MNEQIMRRLVQMALKVATVVLKVILIKTAPIWLPIVLIFSITWLAYMYIYEYPKMAIVESAEVLNHSSGKTDQAFMDVSERIFAFYGDDKKVDLLVFDKYKAEAMKWSEGLTQEQLSQVDMYLLDWQWLAAVDRTLGDPDLIVSRGKGKINTDPQATFKLVRPGFTWETKMKKISTQSCKEMIKQDDEGNEMLDEEGNVVTEYTIQTDISEEPQVLLMRAKTMQGEYVYSYHSETTSITTTSACGTLTMETTLMSLDQIKPISNDWEPLKQVLINHGIVSEKDQEDLFEYWLTFLIDRDGEEFMSLPGDWIPLEGELTWPTQGRLTSQYGMRIHPITSKRKIHNGIDIGAPIGREVVSAADGEVIYAGFMGTAGNTIIIKHDQLETRYYHLSEIIVRRGQMVTKESLIGNVGSTGAVTGPHLHFETRVSGVPVDPLDYYK